MAPLPLSKLWRKSFQALVVFSVEKLLLRLLHELRRTWEQARAQQAGAGQPVKRSELIDSPDQNPYSPSEVALPFTGRQASTFATKCYDTCLG